MTHVIYDKIQGQFETAEKLTKSHEEHTVCDYYKAHSWPALNNTNPWTCSVNAEGELSSR